MTFSCAASVGVRGGEYAASVRRVFRPRSIKVALPLDLAPETHGTPGRSMSPEADGCCHTAPALAVEQEVIDSCQLEAYSPINAPLGLRHEANATWS